MPLLCLCPLAPVGPNRSLAWDGRDWECQRVVTSKARLQGSGVPGVVVLLPFPSLTVSGDRLDYFGQKTTRKNNHGCTPFGPVGDLHPTAQISGV